MNTQRQCVFIRVGHCEAHVPQFAATNCTIIIIIIICRRKHCERIVLDVLDVDAYVIFRLPHHPFHILPVFPQRAGARAYHMRANICRTVCVEWGTYIAGASEMNAIRTWSKF